MGNEVVFMTGATSGLGKISAMKAASEGATILAMARNRKKGESLIKEYHQEYPNGKGVIEIVEGDLDSFESVVKACESVKSKFPVIDMIINNAGIMSFKHRLSQNNVEETLQVNLLSPMLICHLLYDNLRQSSNAKIIFTSSALHQGKIDFENMEFEGKFSTFKVYRQSKLGVILLCRLLADKLKPDNVDIYAQHPGIVRTELGRSAGWFSKLIFYVMGKSPEKGSRTLSYLITTDKSQLVSGEYYVDEKVKKTSDYSYDLRVAEQLHSAVRGYLDKYITSDSAISMTDQIEKG